MSRVTFVVPCFDEAARLRRSHIELEALLASATTVSLLFVDDGSRDGTRELLDGIRARVPERVRVLALTPNRGKGEAVRLGMREALAPSRSPPCDLVGYFDADMATPRADLLRLVGALRDPSLSAVLGSRVKLMGHDIERSTVRHYAGRVFATAASLLLKQPFYDTQCGAKLFRRTPLLEAVLDEPFVTRWLFDVELLGRLLTGTETLAGDASAAFREVPLERWHDVPGSKVGLRGASASAFDLTRVGLDLARRRSRVR